VLADRHDIVNYIPQRAPFVMVHNLIAVENDRATTEFEILGDNVLVRDGFLSESGMVENIAQTVAAQAGYDAHIQNSPTPLGYIANIKDLKVFDLPPVGSLLTTSVQVVNQVFDMTLCKGEVKVRDQVLCQCEIRVFVKSSTNS
jgi:predicted hotdog family 3-hydroxylacyl-ACP dehydratase